MPFTEAFPFKRIFVDHMILGTTRVWWQLSGSMTDPGPYSFQLQFSYVGLPSSPDWVDVGSPVVNNWMATDSERRLRGKLLTAYYRVKLTTGKGSYVSNPAEVYGLMPQEDWALAREIVRKEVLRANKVGRTGYLLKRIRYGELCPRCRDTLTGEITDGRCPECFSADALVRTENGFKRIADIAVGDRVLTIDGTYQRVVETMRRRYTGKAYRVRASTMTHPVTVTPEHPFHAMSSTHVFADIEQQRWRDTVACGPSPCDGFMQKIRDSLTRPTGVSLHTKTGKWRAKVPASRSSNVSITLGYFAEQTQAKAAVLAYRQQHFDLHHRLDWTPAKDLGKFQWLDTTYPHDEHDMLTIDAPVAPVAGRSSCGNRRGATTFAVDAEFLWVTGMYIAEGASGDRSICFALHRKESAYRDRLVRFFARYGFNAKVTYPKGQSMVVSVYSTTLAEWFPRWLGGRAYAKHIPEELMRLPPEKTRAIIQGIWDGDGSKDANEICQTSEILALQLCELLHRLGHQPTIHVPTKRPDRRQTWVISWEEPTLTRENRKGRWLFEGRRLAMVREHEVIDYDDYVYNLEVEGNHTYVVQNIVVHNCKGTGYTTGYHPATPLVCWDVSPEVIDEDKREASGTGQIRNAKVKARVLGFPDVHYADVWIDGHSDQRWYLSLIENQVEIRGMPIVVNVTMELAPFTDSIYRVPVDESSVHDPRDGLPSAGEGCIAINQDYGGENALSYTTAEGCGIAGATIKAYAAADYDNELTGDEYVLATTTTMANGWWTYELKLDAGDYVLVYEKQGEYGPDAMPVTVAEEVTTAAVAVAAAPPPTAVAPKTARILRDFGL